MSEAPQGPEGGILIPYLTRPSRTSPGHLVPVLLPHKGLGKNPGYWVAAGEQEAWLAGLGCLVTVGGAYLQIPVYNVLLVTVVHGGHDLQ